MEAEKTPPVVTLDLSKIKQVMNNLVGNAIKFTPEGGQIFLRSVALNADQLRLTVQDTGVGISQEDLEKVFNKFEQVKDRKVGTKGERGSGLGLAICKNLVELHGGRIWVESELGKGSQFHLEIPIHAAN